jgi:adenylate kinase
LRSSGARFDVAVHLEVPRDLAIERLSRRMVCVDCGATGAGARCATCGGRTQRRQDDTPEAIARRLDAFEAETAPLIAWLDGAGLLVTVDGAGSTSDVARRVEAAVRDVLGSELPGMRGGQRQPG